MVADAIYRCKLNPWSMQCIMSHKTCTELWFASICFLCLITSKTDLRDSYTGRCMTKCDTKQWQISSKANYIPIYTCMFVKVTFKIPNMSGQQHSFTTHGRLFLRKCQSFWNRKCLDPVVTWTSNLRIQAECSTIWATEGRHLVSHVLEYWLWWYKYLCFSYLHLKCQLCASKRQQHSFSIPERMLFEEV